MDWHVFRWVTHLVSPTADHGPLIDSSFVIGVIPSSFELRHWRLLSAPCVCSPVVRSLLSLAFPSPPQTHRQYSAGGLRLMQRAVHGSHRRTTARCARR